MIFEVYGHTFIAEEIIGISPLYIKKPSGDQATEMVYKPRIALLTLHLKQHSVEIATDQIVTTDGAQKFKQEYEKLTFERQKVLDMLTEREIKAIAGEMESLLESIPTSILVETIRYRKEGQGDSEEITNQLLELARNQK